jgi:hypothetical protein
MGWQRADSPWRQAALASKLIVFGLTLSSVLQDEALTRRPRRLDVVELFSGVASVQKAADSNGLQSRAFDIINSPEQNICSEEGFRLALSWVLDLRENGLLGMGVVCSSWVTLNCRGTKRKLADLEGDVSYAKTAEGNHMARAAAFLFLVAVARNVHAYIENPAGSMLFRYLEEFNLLPLSSLPFLRTAITHRCHWSTEPYGKRWLKAFKFLATGEWIQKLGEGRCKCPAGPNGKPLHLPLVKQGKKKGSRTGLRKELQQSASYPPALGFAIVEAWLLSQPAAMEFTIPAPDSSTSLTSAAQLSIEDAGEEEPETHDSGSEWSAWGAEPDIQPPDVPDVKHRAKVVKANTRKGQKASSTVKNVPSTTSQQKPVLDIVDVPEPDSEWGAWGA